MTRGAVLTFAIVYSAIMLGGSAALRHASADAPVYQGAPVRPADALWLARGAVGECGWSALDCHAAVVGVMARKSARHHVRMGTLIRQYSAALRRPRRPWVLGLLDRADAPPAWPDVSSWRAHRPLWRAAREGVDAQLRSERLDPCEAESPEHFGGPEGVDASMGAAWEEVDCVPSSPQRFYRRASGDPS